ncbi:hypothetical protein F5Y08DRAFT_349863 [Xylaria arbuscula]|nr:hypothetical protein F5Y08DRAFT_349863 [Xylaria arbuscula]
MVTPTCCAPSEAGSRRYSRPCPPYSFTYSDRRQQYSFHDNRTMTMADREESDQPRKRIAVAVNVASEKLDVAVSSHERHLKDGGFPYSLEAARLGHQGGGPMSPLASMPPYAYDVGAADGLTSYRPSTYSYNDTGSTKHYYSTTQPWSSTYADDSTSNVDYYYSPTPLVSQESSSSSFVPGYSQPYNTRRSVYADPEASAYSPYSLAHRPAVSGGSQGFALSTMSSIAASLPGPDRIQSHAGRTLTSSSGYRTDAMPTQYATTAIKTSPSEISYSNSTLHPAFESAYSTTGALASPIAHRASSTHAEYGAPSGAATTDHQLYTSGEQGVRPSEDATSAGLGYIYGDTASNTNTNANNNNNSKIASSGSRRDSHNSYNSSSGVSGGSLANGQVYVPESHSAHPTPHPYVLSNSTSSTSHSQGRAAAVDSATASGGAAAVAAGGRGSGGSSSGSSGSSSHHHNHHHRSSESQRRTAGTHRGA